MYSDNDETNEEETNPTEIYSNTPSTLSVYTDKLRRNWKKVAAALLILFTSCVLLGVLVGGSNKQGGAPRTIATSTSNPRSPDGEGKDSSHRDEDLIQGTTQDGPVVVESAPQDTDIPFVTLSLEPLYQDYQLDASALSNPSSPQAYALQFVLASVDDSTTTRNIQRFALACFYYSTYRQAHAFWTNPNDWIENGNWLESNDECTWKGVTCVNGVVEELALPRNGLTGSLPLELVFLTNLHSLDLNTNFVYQPDELHAVFGMPSLKSLDLSDNFVTAEQGLPEPLLQHPTIEKIVLSYNLLQGSLPETLDLPALTHLEMESNYISGSLPHALGGLDNLYYLYVRRNWLDVDLQHLLEEEPTQSYRQIFSLWLDDNNVTGTLPDHLGEWSDLASLSITNTTLSGSLPDSMGTLQDLQRVWLYNNQLTGLVPQSLANLNKLEIMQLHDNLLRGELPPRVCTTIQASRYEYAQALVDCDRVACACCGC